MNGSYLLDTNIVIAIFKRESVVLDVVSNVNETLIPSIVVGELFFGAQKSSRPLENFSRIDDLVEDNEILVCDAYTARWYGQIKNELRVKGRPIPENDIWIAALAFQHSLTLVTRDSHFNEINSLKLEVW